MKPCALLQCKDAIGAASLTVCVYRGTAQNDSVVKKRGLPQVYPNFPQHTYRDKVPRWEFSDGRSHGVRKQPKPLPSTTETHCQIVFAPYLDLSVTRVIYSCLAVFIPQRPLLYLGSVYKYRPSDSQGSPKSGRGGQVAKAAETHADSVHLLQLSSAAGCHRVEVGKVKRTDFSFFPPL